MAPRFSAVRAALCVLALAPGPGLAQSVTERLLGPLALPSGVPPAGLHVALAAVLEESGGATYDPATDTYDVLGCPETPMSARLVDLNGDPTPEVLIEAYGSCVGGMAGGYSWVLIQPGPGDPWRPSFGFNGGLVPLTTTTSGYVDVMAAGPGFCHGLWAWTGREYGLRCVASFDGADCGPRACSRATNTAMAADSLRAFSGPPSPPAQAPAGATDPVGVGEAVDAYVRRHPAYHVADESEFEGLAFLREYGDPARNPYVARGRINGDRWPDRAVVLGGPRSADQSGWGWPVHDVRILILHGQPDGTERVGHVIETSLPLGALMVAVDDDGLSYAVYETDATWTVRQRGGRYIVEHVDPGY